MKFLPECGILIAYFDKWILFLKIKQHLNYAGHWGFTLTARKFSL